MRGGIRVYVGECKVLEFAFHLPHAEAVGDRSVNLQRFKRDALAFMFGYMLQRLHVVFSVCELHDEHADVARGRD